MISGVAFDIYRPLLPPSRVAELCGVKRPVVDTMSTRGFIAPEGRERATERPLFSFRDVFKVGLMRSMAPLGMGLKESSLMAEALKKRKIDKSEAATDWMAELADMADTPAMKGEWMWAMARSVERGKPFYIYAYAARINNKWQFDMHIENPGTERPSEQPCFGWKVPHIYVPVGKIFITAYNESKKVLGLTMGEEA